MSTLIIPTLVFAVEYNGLIRAFKLAYANPVSVTADFPWKPYPIK